MSLPAFLNRANTTHSSNNLANKEFIWKLALLANQTFKIVPLAEPYFGEDEEGNLIRLMLKVHVIMGTGTSALCDKMYSDSMGICTRCEEPSPFGGENGNFASKVLVFPGYVLDHVDKERVSKKGTPYKENPIKVIEVPGGKEQFNWRKFDKSYKEDGDFLDKIWTLTKVKGGLDVDTIPWSKLGNQVKEVPAAIKNRFNSMSPSEIIAFCLSAYTNVKWDHPDFVKDGIVMPEHLKNETSFDLPKPSLDEE
jgi:hypothetical protein